MKFYFILFSIVLLYNKSTAQQITPQIINCAGQSFSTTASKLAYSIGEIAITKVGNSNNSITQGFFQPKITANSIKENESSFKFTAYPNPSYSSIRIESQGYNDAYTVKLLDCTGREIYSGSTQNNMLSLENYQNGIYHLLILNNKKQLLERKTITKLN